MLWLRGFAFTLLVPGTIAVIVPGALRSGRLLRGGVWQAGWIAIAAGSIIYLSCLLRFLTAGGTPEPGTLVRQGLYRWARNPMYVGVLLVVFGQAAGFSSGGIAVYGAVLWLLFHIVVVALEEPHLRAAQGPRYEELPPRSTVDRVRQTKPLTTESTEEARRTTESPWSSVCSPCSPWLGRLRFDL